MIKTSALHRDNDPNSNYPKGGKSVKWNKFLNFIWKNRKEYEGKGVVVIPSDPNALFERLDLLLASKEAICDKLKRQGHLDTRSYKKLNSIIKK